MLKINRTTVYRSIKRYLERGHVRRRQVKYKPHIIKVMNYIDNKNLLESWASFTLVERAELIRKSIGVSIRPSVLQKLHVRLGIKYKNVKLTYQLTDEQKTFREREQYAKQLAQLVYENKRLLYLDETTFNYHMRQTKVWQYQDNSIHQSFKLPLANRRFSGVTVFGCIGNCLKKPVFMSA